MTEQEFLLHKIQKNEKRIKECNRSMEESKIKLDEMEQKIKRLNDSLVESSSDFLFIPKDNPEVQELNCLLNLKSKMEENVGVIKEEIDGLTQENGFFENLLKMINEIKNTDTNQKEKLVREETGAVPFNQKEQINTETNICSYNQIPVDIEILKSLKSILSLSKKISLSDSRRCNVEIGKALSMIDKIL